MQISLQQLLIVILFFALSFWTWQNVRNLNRANSKLSVVTKLDAALDLELGFSDELGWRAALDQLAEAQTYEDVTSQMLVHHAQLAKQFKITPKSGSLISLREFPCVLENGLAQGYRIFVSKKRKLWLRGGWRIYDSASPQKQSQDPLDKYLTVKEISNSGVHQIELTEGNHEIQLESRRLDSELHEVRLIFDGQEIVSCIIKDSENLRLQARSSSYLKQFNVKNRKRLKGLEGFMSTSLTVPFKKTHYVYQLWISDQPRALPEFPKP